MRIPRRCQAMEKNWWNMTKLGIFFWWNEAQKIWRSTAHQIPWVVDSLIQPWDLIIFIRARSKHIPNDSNKTGGLQILWNWIVSQVGPFWCHVHFSRSWHQRITLYTPPICSLLRRFIRVLIQDPEGATVGRVAKTNSWESGWESGWEGGAVLLPPSLWVSLPSSLSSSSPSSSAVS